MSKDTKSLNTDRISDPENFSSTLLTLSPDYKKPIEMSISAEKISSDGGLLLLREIEARNGTLQSITNCIKEDRHSGYVKHSVKSMLTQRVFQIAAGYEDANDCDTLRDNMILKICNCKLSGSFVNMRMTNEISFVIRNSWHSHILLSYFLIRTFWVNVDSFPLTVKK